MKKIFVIALAAVAISMTSCKKDVAAQAEAYAKEICDAMKAEDLDKAMEVAQKAEEWQKTLSPEEIKIAEEAGAKVMQAAGLK